MRSVCTLWLCALPVLVGCPQLDRDVDDGGVSTPDAQAPVEAIRMPQPPTPPSTPELTCHEGWRVSTAPGRASTCEPWPGLAPASCATGEAHLPGQPGCSAIGSPCPMGDLPELVPLPAVALYVHPSSTDGDGTAHRPFGSIAEALSRSTPGTVIALSKGTHVGPLEPPAEITVVGACTAETRVTTVGIGDAAVTIGAGSVTLKDLSIADTSGAGIVALGPTTTVQLMGVQVARARVVGLLVGEGATVTGSRVVISETQADAAQGGRALQMEYGGSLHLQQAALVDNQGLGGFVADAGSDVILEDSAVIGTRWSNHVTRGGGLEVCCGASLSLRRSVLLDNQDAGLVAAEGALLTLADVVVRQTRVLPTDGTGGFGLEGQDAQVTIDRGLFDANREVGLLLSGTMLQASDLVLRGTEGSGHDNAFGMGLVQLDGASTLERVAVEDNRASGLSVRRGELTGQDILVVGTRSDLAIRAAGHGIEVAERATLTASRTELADNRTMALVAIDSRVEMSDLAVRRTRPTELDLRAGRGLVLGDGTEAILQRLVAEENHEAAVVIYQPSTHVRIEDGMVVDTHSQQSDGTLGWGMAVQGGATAELARVVFERNRDVGVLASSPETRLSLEDVRVLQTDSQQSDGTGGRGIGVQLGAVMQGNRIGLMDNREASLTAGGANARVTLQGLLIEHTHAPRCAEDGCENASVGLVSAFRAVTEVDGFVILGDSVCGVQVSDGGELDLLDGEIAGHTIGACIQVDGYDVRRLSTMVRYHDNETRTQATALPVPEPVDVVVP